MLTYFAPYRLEKAFSLAAHELTAHFYSNGYELYAVGGAVRDALIGREVSDVDFATNAFPQEVMRICKYTIATGLQHGTVTVLWKGESFEVTTYRTDEHYSNFRQPDSVSFSASLQCDLARRDFTVNALALCLVDGFLHDPYGGQGDMKRRLIRCVGTPYVRFTEDALRMMRCVRFATTLRFEIDTTTKNAIKKCAHLVSHISRERIAMELRKTLLAPDAFKGYAFLRETGVYGFVFPNIGNACGADYTDDDTARLLRAIVATPHAHDEKMREVLTHAALFAHKNAKSGAQCAQQAYVALKLPKKLMSRIVTVLRSNNMRLYKAHVSAGERSYMRRLRLLITLIGLDHAWDLVVFHMAQECAWRDSRAMDELNLCAAYLHQCMKSPQDIVQSPADVRISGSAIAQCLQKQPGKWLGDVKKTLMRLVSAHPEKNTPEALLAYVKDMQI